MTPLNAIIALSESNNAILTSDPSFKDNRKLTNILEFNKVINSESIQMFYSIRSQLDVQAIKSHSLELKVDVISSLDFYC